MKVYLASQYSSRELMKQYAKILEQHRITVTSSWLREKANPLVDLTELTDRFNRDHAKTDIADIDDSEVVVVFTVSPTTLTKRGGRHFETGYAYAQHKRIVVCGPKEIIFHHLPDVMQFDTFDEVVAYLLTLKDRAW